MDLSTADPLVGQLFDDRYRIDARVARGGMATVYVGFDTRLDRVVAIKVMHATLADDPEFVERFRREAKAAARLSHPNVVAIHDQGEGSGHPYLVMEHVQGRTLRALMRDTGALSPDEALGILEGMLAALAAAHTAGLVHRDMKPENVLLADSGAIKVADFGLARPMEATQYTIADGRILGSPAYLAPEQVQSGAADARTDLYSCGIVLFEMVTGTPPFVGEAAFAVANRHVTDDIPAPSTVTPGVPRAVDELVAAATRRDPQERFQDAQTMLSAVRRARASVASGAGSETTVIHLDDAPTLITRVPPPDATKPLPAVSGAAPKAPRATRSRKPLVIALVLALVLGVAGGVGWWYGTQRYIEAPEVVRLSEVDAREVAEAQELDIELTDPVFSETVPKGLVVSQDPPAGEDIRRGGTLTITLSAGPDRVRVPKVVGLTEAAARRALQQARLGVATVTKAYDEKVKEGLVISVAPSPDTVAKPGDKVALVVSRGRQPITVPNVVGDRRGEAVDKLTRLGLDPEVKEEFSEKVPAGEVMAQAPTEGATRFRGDRVTLTVSKGPETFPVPDVVGETRGKAREILEDAGFTVRFVDFPGREGRRVYDQDPNAGSRAQRGAQVTLDMV